MGLQQKVLKESSGIENKDKKPEEKSDYSKSTDEELYIIDSKEPIVYEKRILIVENHSYKQNIYLVSIIAFIVISAFIALLFFPDRLEIYVNWCFKVLCCITALIIPYKLFMKK